MSLRISAKNLGDLAMPGFCPRCFWLSLHSERLPFQVFPGIFSSIDSYSKKITGYYYETHQEMLSWLIKHGFEGRPVRAPGHQKFRITHEATDIILTGVVDEMIELTDGSFALIDYKTAKFTKSQDRMLPLYEVQLNGYAYIGERIGFSPVSKLALLYYEPITDIEVEQINNLVDGERFLLGFSAHIHPIALKPESIEPLLYKARQLYELKTAPQGAVGCADCQAIDSLVELLHAGRN